MTEPRRTSAAPAEDMTMVLPLLETYGALSAVVTIAYIAWGLAHSRGDEA